MGGDPCLRSGGQKDGPVVTDNGNFVIDCNFGLIEDPFSLESDIEQIPGVVCAGLFTGFREKVQIVVGEQDGSRILPL
jgi:ribose 5-phosphate isomerase A